MSEYIVKPSDFQIMQRKDGCNWLLGQGAFGKVHCLSACLLLAKSLPLIGSGHKAAAASLDQAHTMESGIGRW